MALYKVESRLTTQGYDLSAFENPENLKRNARCILYLMFEKPHKTVYNVTNELGKAAQTVTCVHLGKKGAASWESL